MSLGGSHILLICTDYPAEDEADFNAWYVREHVPERVGLPGFLRGRRYAAIGDGPGYCAFYEVKDAAALASPEYLGVMRDPDPRSRYFIPRFVRPARTVARVVATAGRGEGGVLGLVAFDAPERVAERLAEESGSVLVASLAGRPGIVGAHLWQADAATLEQSRRSHLRSGDTVYPWVLAVEATDGASLRSLREGPMSAAVLGGELGFEILTAADYRLLYSLSATERAGITQE